MKVFRYKFYMWRSRHARDFRLKSHYKHMAKRALYRKGF